MNPQALDSLLEILRLDCRGLAQRLGGRPEHYERLSAKERLPFPVWDAVQRLAYREGYAWDAESNSWQKTRTGLPAR